MPKKETESQKRTRIRRERILEFVKHQYKRLAEAREEYLKIPETQKEKREIAWNRYILLLNEGFMFRYGVAMADPYGKWMKKFDDIFDEVEKEMNVDENV